MAEYWVRNNGGTSKAAAVDLANAMNVAAFNAASFSSSDVIKFSSIDGNITSRVVPPSGGITLISDPNQSVKTIIHGSDTLENCIDIVSKNDVTVENIDTTHPTTDGVQIRGISTGVVVRNVESSYSGNQAFQMEDTAVAMFYDIIGRNCTDDGFSMHGGTNAKIYRGVFTDNAQGINTISNSYIETYDCIVSGCTGESLYTADASAEGKTPIAKHFNCTITGGSKIVRAAYNGDMALVNCTLITGGCVDQLIDIESTGKILVFGCIIDAAVVSKFGLAIRSGATCNGVYNTVFKGGVGKGVYTNANTDIVNCILAGLNTAVYQVAGTVQLRNSCNYGTTVTTVGTVTTSNILNKNPLLDSNSRPSIYSPCLERGVAITGVTDTLADRYGHIASDGIVNIGQDLETGDKLGPWTAFDGSLQPLTTEEKFRLTRTVVSEGPLASNQINEYVVEDLK